MFELFIGIILGASFPEFWAQLYQSAKKKVTEWTSSQKSSSNES